MPRHTLEAAEKPILDIFCEKYVFRIPPYQRPYAWTTEQAGELLDDILNAYGTAGDVKDQSPYFLGSIVLIKDPQRPEADVVDGQQRLTTLTILLAVLRDIEGGRIGQTLDKRIRLEGDVITGTPDTFLVTPRERDAKFFRDTIQTNGATKNLPPLDTLKDVRQLFVGNTAFLRGKVSALTREQRQRLASYILQRCYLVVVAASDRKSAFRIFSVLNSRGLDLSPADVLKSDIIGAISEPDQDNYTETWEDLEDELGRARFAELIGHIRMIHRKQKMRGNLVAEFKEFVPAFKEPKRFIDDELAPYAEAYQEILEGQFASPVFADDINRYLRHLSQLDNFDWQPPAVRWIAKNRSKPEGIFHFLADLERLAYGLFLQRADPTDRITRYGKILTAMEDGSDLAASTAPLQLSDSEKQAVLKALDGDIYTTTRLRRPILLQLRRRPVRSRRNLCTSDHFGRTRLAADPIPREPVASRLP